MAAGTVHGIVGENGAGKSTLLSVLLGEIEPSRGRVRRGARLEVAYYDQQRAQLDLDAPVTPNINARSDFVMVNGENRHVSELSGGFPVLAPSSC